MKWRSISPNIVTCKRSNNTNEYLTTLELVLSEFARLLNFIRDDESAKVAAHGAIFSVFLRLMQDYLSAREDLVKFWNNELSVVVLTAETVLPNLVE